MKKNGVALTGTLETNGVTFYTRNGKTIIRSATSLQPERRSLKQFVGRERMAHSTTLWRRLKWQVQPLFTGGANPYARFMSLASKMPVVYLTAEEHRSGGSLLIPGMPVADGELPRIECTLGELDGQPALYTNLPAKLTTRDSLRFYTFTQRMEQRTPKVNIYTELQNVDNHHEYSAFRDTELRFVDGKAVLVGEMFADDMKGWALIHISGDQWTSAQVVTRCNFYERYTTEEAMMAAAASYGGLTDK